jgi:hypothetical protein
MNQITEDKIINLAAFCAQKLFPWKCKLQMGIVLFSAMFLLEKEIKNSFYFTDTLFQS